VRGAVHEVRLSARIDRWREAAPDDEYPGAPCRWIWSRQVRYVAKSKGPPKSGKTGSWQADRASGG